MVNVDKIMKYIKFLIMLLFFLYENIKLLIFSRRILKRELMRSKNLFSKTNDQCDSTRIIE